MQLCINKIDKTYSTGFFCLNMTLLPKDLDDMDQEENI